MCDGALGGNAGCTDGLLSQNRANSRRVRVARSWLVRFCHALPPWTQLLARDLAQAGKCGLAKR